MTRALDLAVTAACFGAAFLIGQLVADAAPDDSWISVRYARNLLAGFGWCYDIGVPVNAATSTANTLALALGGALLGDFRAAQVAVFTVGLGGAAAGLFLGLRESAPGDFAARVPGVVAAALCLTTPLFWACVGMESPLLLLSAVAAWLAWTRNKFVLAAAAAGFLALVRPEGALLPVLLLADRAWRRESLRALPWTRMALVFGLPLLAWGIFSLIRFGALAPDTLAAKRAQAESGWWTLNLFARGAKHSLAVFDQRGFGLGYKPFVGLFGVALGVALAARHAVRPLLGFAALVCAGYAALGVPYFHWYVAPLHLGLTVAVVAAFDAAWRTRRPGLRAVGALAVAALLALQSPAWTPRAREYLAYREAAGWLDEHAPDTASVGCVEIGVIGNGVWPRPIVDACGLVTPDVVPDLRAGRVGAWFERHRPDWVVLHVPPWDGFEAIPQASPAFADYREVFRTSCGSVRVCARIR